MREPGSVDLERLASWMDSQGLGKGPIEAAERIAGGTQNVLLLFRRADRAYVLRRPPAHKRPNSDETMRREARVLAALAGSDVPHPGLIAACGDVDVLGAAFYLMEAVEGSRVTAAHRSRASSRSRPGSRNAARRRGHLVSSTAISTSPMC